MRPSEDKACLARRKNRVRNCSPGSQVEFSKEEVGLTGSHGGLHIIISDPGNA